MLGCVRLVTARAMRACAACLLLLVGTFASAGEGYTRLWPVRGTQEIETTVGYAVAVALIALAGGLLALLLVAGSCVMCCNKCVLACTRCACCAPCCVRGCRRLNCLDFDAQRKERHLSVFRALTWTMALLMVCVIAATIVAEVGAIGLSLAAGPAASVALQAVRAVVKVGEGPRVRACCWR